MNTRTVEFSYDVAKGLLQCAEANLEAAQDRLSEADYEVKKWQTVVAELRAKLGGPELQSNGKPRVRRAKGESAETVAELLRNMSSGQGLSLSEVTKRT